MTREDDLAVLVVLLPAGPAAFGTAVVRGLGELGVTSVELLGDSVSTAVVLEGWAFSPADSTTAVLDLLAAPDGSRVLNQLAHVAVHTASNLGGTT